MIEKLDRHIKTEENGVRISCPPTHADCIDKINELVDVVNELHEEAENNARIRAKHENLIDTLVEENNIHERQIDELQMKVKPEKCETPVDSYAEQRKWIGKLCRFWDEKEEEKVFGILTTIDSDCGLSDMCPYWNDTTKNWFEHCEPVKDDIIYKKEQQ
jgi:oligoendopeptidase F